MITDGAGCAAVVSCQSSVVSRGAGGVDANGCGVDPYGSGALCFFHELHEFARI